MEKKTVVLALGHRALGNTLPEQQRATKEAAKAIADIVETGATLRENDLAVVAEVLPISARLIANKAAYRFKSGEVDRLTERMKGLVET